MRTRPLIRPTLFAHALACLPPCRRLPDPGPIWPAALLLLLAAAPAIANDAALTLCRQETAPDKRLACYDAINVQGRTMKTPAPAPAGPAAAGTTAATAAAIAAPAVPESPASRFGLRSADAALAAVDSQLTGRFEGWGPKTQFSLANGQVWEVEDGSSAALWLDSPKVRVRRGFAGAYYLEVDGSNRSPRVRRLK